MNRIFNKQEEVSSPTKVVPIIIALGICAILAVLFYQILTPVSAISKETDATTNEEKIIRKLDAFGIILVLVALYNLYMFFKLVLRVL
jgi:hypothetical protein